MRKRLSAIDKRVRQYLSPVVNGRAAKNSEEDYNVL